MGQRSLFAEQRTMSGATCKGCGALIVWGLTEAGKKVPLNPPERRYVALHAGRFRIVETWLSHHATCPKRDDFRRPS